MAGQNNLIPWAGEEDWGQVVLSLRRTIAAPGLETAAMRILAKRIGDGYADLDTILEEICRQSCPVCTDICCSRATVWYDLPDLLVVYLTTGAFPEGQIYRRPGRSCCNLTPAGCRLTRSGRPFICTWYICPEQQNIVRRMREGNGKGAALFHRINEIKAARKDLEQAYVDSICR